MWLIFVVLAILWSFILRYNFLNCFLKKISKTQALFRRCFHLLPIYVFFNISANHTLLAVVFINQFLVKSSFIGDATMR